jgi:hypothetical protein
MKPLKDTIVRILKNQNGGVISQQRLVSLVFLSECKIVEKYKQRLTDLEYTKLENGEVHSRKIIEIATAFKPYIKTINYNWGNKTVQKYLGGAINNYEYTISRNALLCIDTIVQYFKGKPDRKVTEYVKSIDIVQEKSEGETINLDYSVEKILSEELT